MRAALFAALCSTQQQCWRPVGHSKGIISRHRAVVGRTALPIQTCFPLISHSHSPAPLPAGIPPTHKRARGTATAIFQLTAEGKIARMFKDWDKLSMWQQLGWAGDGLRLT